MRWLPSVKLAVTAPVLLALGLPVSAQIAPGFDEPTNLAEAAVDTLGYACFLVASKRPWAGINTPSLGMDGEGLVEENTPPAWFAESLIPGDKYRFSSLKTPEGKLWIAYGKKYSTCSIGAIPPDKSTFKAGFLKNFPHAAGNWKKSESEAPLLKKFKGSLENVKGEWDARYWEQNEHTGPIFARMSFSLVKF